MNDLRSKTKVYLNDRLKSGRDTALQHKGFKGVIDTEELDIDHFKEFLKDIDSTMTGSALIKDGGATKVANLHINGEDYILKRYNWRGWRKGLRYMIKGSRARHVWFYGHLLNSIDVGSPGPVCWLEKVRKNIVRESYVLTKYVNGITLFEYLRAHAHSAQDKQNLLNKMKEVFQKLFSYRITHGDMKRSNVLVVNNNICLIDLDATALNRNSFIYKIRKGRDLKRFLEKMESDEIPEDIINTCRSMVFKLYEL